MDCALAGYPAASRPRAAVAAQKGDHAGVLVVTEVPHEYPYLVACLRTQDGWIEGSSGTGRIQWRLTDEEQDRGVLYVWGRTEGAFPTVKVGGRMHEPTATADDGYWILVLTEVPNSVIDDIEVRS